MTSRRMNLLLGLSAAALGALATVAPALSAPAARAPRTPARPAKAARSAAARRPVLTIRANQTGATVSPLLYGIFFEEINHAGDGGLYAELVRNRSFDDAEQPEAWSLVTTRGTGTMALDTSRPLNPANPRSLKLEVTSVSPGQSFGRVGVANEGYWGIAVRQGAEYRLSLYARRNEAFQGPLSVSLEGAKGMYAAAQITGLTPEWQRYTVTLRSTGTDPKARLVISVASPGTVWLDTVSLFPADTFKGRPNGLRKDLAEKLAALRPGFMRFPGGCYVEGGDRLADAFRWSNTVGDIAERPGHNNANWGYRSTDGLGYHEYLQMCEDLGAVPLFVVNCGMSHREQVPVNDLQPWIQEALDAIEYANGPATSKWGALRAKNGHPAPFGLKFIEIGNENGMFGSFGGTLEQYAERYKPFYDAIKAKYPDIQCIADIGVPHPYDIIDEHYYNSTGWFWENVHRYDRANRQGPQIYLGEYAMTWTQGKGNLAGALSEAAFMTGLERNADIVTMGSYAPLFVNENDRRWNPDLIVFDSARSYGTPSYHVQRLFANNRPSVNVAVDVPEIRPASGAGSVGVGTWNTQAEFKDIEVVRNGRVVYRSNFGQGANGWKPGAGEWKVVDGAYRQAGEGEDRWSLLDAPALKNARDYTLRLKARKLGGAEGFLVLFRATDRDNYYWWNVGGWGNSRNSIERASAGMRQEIGRSVPGKLETGRWYDVRIEARGQQIRCYLDDKLIQQATDQGISLFAAAAGRDAATGDIIVKAVNGTDKPQPMTLAVLGAKLAPQGSLTVLRSVSGNDENTFAQPNKVAPVSRTLVGVSSRFAHTFPPYSLTVLRLKPAGVAAQPGTKQIGKANGLPAR